LAYATTPAARFTTGKSAFVVTFSTEQ